MSAPSRRPEIRRRRTRAEKIAKLRKRLAAASASSRQRPPHRQAASGRLGFSGEPVDQERVDGKDVLWFRTAELRSAWTGGTPVSTQAR